MLKLYSNLENVHFVLLNRHLEHLKDRFLGGIICPFADSFEKMLAFLVRVFLYTNPGKESAKGSLPEFLLSEVICHSPVLVSPLLSANIVVES